MRIFFASGGSLVFGTGLKLKDVCKRNSVGKGNKEEEATEEHHSQDHLSLPLLRAMACFGERR